MTRIDQYLRYHIESARIGDIDPAHAMLLYVCNRYELNTEQRYWLAWLYAMTYSGPSAFYIYNEFPDYENVDVSRLERWWYLGGRDKVICQTDRRWVRSSHQFVPAFVSYKSWINGKTQHEHFAGKTNWPTAETRYDALYESAKQLFSFGQFALFLYLESLHVVTPLDLCPTDLDLEKAWSCRNGLYYAYGLDHLLEEKQSSIRPEAIEETAVKWSELRVTLSQLEHPPTVWNTETILCAFRKYQRNRKRYIGSYLDRQAIEICKMENNVTEGVCWDVLWQFRNETYLSAYRVEDTGDVTEKGVSRDWKETALIRTDNLLRGEV